jgi:putative transposase
MPKKRFSAEQIVVLLRQIEVLMSQGNAAPVACREAGISQQSYYRWRKEYGGLEIDQAKRMKDLERENVRLSASSPICRWRSKYSRTLPWETCKPRAAPAGCPRHSGEVRPLGTPGLPDGRPAPRNTAIRHHRSS